MKGNERLDKFLELQDKGIAIDEISKELGIVTKTLKSFLNKRGYKLENGRYILKEEKEINQIEFSSINVGKKENNKNKPTKIIKTPKKKIEIKKSQPKKDRKINMTQEDMDKLCEVYDWYMQVKDYRAVKPKRNNKKDINMDKRELKDLKSTSIKVDKKTWEDFERICSNSQFSKIEILTQALNDFMNEYKHLL